MMKPPQHPATPGVSRSRAQAKCTRCREKKVKCLPEIRDWALGIRCNECVKAGEPCSENTRVQRGAAQSSPATTVATPALGPYSPEDSFRRSDELVAQRQEPIAGCDEPRQSLGSFASTELTSNASIGTDATLETEKWQPHDNPFHQALTQLCTMGMLIDLYEYLQARSDAITKMQQAWPLKKHHDFIAALDFFTLAVGNTILTTFRHVLQLRSQVSIFQKELLTRRAFDTGRRYVAASGRLQESGLDKASSFDKAFRGIVTELVIFYRAHGDHSEVNRLHRSPERQSYLAEYNLDMMSTLSNGLCEVLKSTFGDIKEAYRQVLDPSGTLKICAAHLTILSCRRGDSIDPLLYTLEETIDITGRNVLHLAAEVSDVKYLRWALQRLGHNRRLLLEMRDTFGLTPLMVAAYAGCLDTFTLLVNEGAELKAQDPTARSILCLASMAGHEPIVSFILSQGVKIQDAIEFCSPIHDAAAAGRSEAVIQTLLNRKAEPRDERNEHGNLSASKVAAKYGHNHLTRILSEAEQRLERQLPTEGIDPYGPQIRSLKRQVEDAMRSASPESPASCSALSRTMPPAPEAARSKRPRNAGQRQWSAPHATGSSFRNATPHMVDGPVVPSAQFQSPINLYSTDIAAKLNSASSTNPRNLFQEFTVDDSDEFSTLFGDASHNDLVDLTEDES